MTKTKTSKTKPGKTLIEDVCEPCRLYLVTPPKLEPRGFAETLKAALDAGDVASLQLRLKSEGEMMADADTIRRASDILLPLTQSYGAAFIINDSVELAHETGADGVHLGQDDMPYAEARKLLGAERIIGVTCHDSRHFAMEAGEAGADYVAFGAFFDTSTKQAKTRASVELLIWWSDTFVVPCVAIGGITLENAPSLIEAGADFLAVSAGVWAHPQGPAHAVRGFNALMGRS